MGTWISHLRVADFLLDCFPSLERTAFLYGNLAPDSGKPNENWTEFDPPKEVTHFLTKGSDEGHICDLEFYEAFVRPIVNSVDSISFSFHLGYFTHLFFDKYWSTRFGPVIKATFAHLKKNHTADQSWELIKTDWYDLDHKFLRDHPHNHFWSVFQTSSIPQIPLSFISQESFSYQIHYIRSYYSQPDSDQILDRTYPYLNQNMQDRIIQDASLALTKLLPMLEKTSPSRCFHSAIELLPDDEKLPYSTPFGDL